VEEKREDPIKRISFEPEEREEISNKFCRHLY
jgi:hypothetical protein